MNKKVGDFHEKLVKIIKLAIENGLNSNQIIYLSLLQIDEHELLDKYMHNLSKISDKKKLSGLERVTIKDVEENELINKVLLTDFNASKSDRDRSLLRPTSQFYSIFQEDEDDDKWFKELIQIYPSTVVVNGSSFPTKPGADIDTVIHNYMLQIKTEEEHKEVLSITEWAAKNNKLNMKLSKYVYTSFWTALKEEKSNQFEFGKDV